MQLINRSLQKLISSSNVIYRFPANQENVDECNFCILLKFPAEMVLADVPEVVTRVAVTNVSGHLRRQKSARLVRI